ncbi:hypothetical protein GLAREA_09141 [Glarea lozoyensis ATCC 20868]|uniref:Uncharacterized protein n=1 Tax=Glarea lozoyensis (strain ATCC 20868 / MF5171) TaxID=1116229 RepID=S3EFL6_GLAL2|nr:uncharacterized protein GLAREA_09141 [Glarea lozoyensis ATCC 20868]EPE36978.1 hypothetical protein GLAREA_09141 [Glarea lozoyensis ATCC 20868]
MGDTHASKTSVWPTRTDSISLQNLTLLHNAHLATERKPSPTPRGSSKIRYPISIPKSPSLKGEPTLSQCPSLSRTTTADTDPAFTPGSSPEENEDYLTALTLRSLKAEIIAIDAAKTAIDASKLASEAKLESLSAQQALRDSARFEREKTNVIVQLKAKKHVAEVEEMFENIGKDVKQEMKVEEKKFFDTWEDYRDWEGYAEKLSDNCKGDKDMRIMDNVEVSKISGRTRGVTVSVIDENFEMKVKKLHQRLAESRAYQALEERKQARERMARETPVESDVAGEEVKASTRENKR